MLQYYIKQKSKPILSQLRKAEPSHHGSCENRDFGGGVKKDLLGKL